MTRIKYFLFAVISALFLCNPLSASAFEFTSFTGSNITFDPNTNNLSFDHTDFGLPLQNIAQISLYTPDSSIEYYRTGADHQSGFECNPTHCDVSNMYQENAYTPGNPVIVVVSVQDYGVSKSQNFILSETNPQITTTIIKNTITQMYTNGSITKLGSSLYDKLTQAQAAIEANEYPQAKATLQALINQINAQIDIHITAGAAVILIDQIHTLMNSLPQ